MVEKVIFNLNIFIIISFPFSYVKLIEYSKVNERKLIISTLTETDQMILSLAKHRYGNYVLQKCLERIEGVIERREVHKFKYYIMFTSFMIVYVHS